MKWIFLLNSADTNLYFPKLKKTQFGEIKKTRKIKEEYLGRGLCLRHTACVLA